MDILGIFGILLGILTIILFIIKKFNVIIAAPIATIVLLLFNGVPILETLFGKENSYMTALAGFVASNFAIFLLGSILAKYMDKSGATISISNKILSLVGTRNPYNAFVALFIISAVLTYGGINVFVVIFALIPMARPIFRQLDIPWKLVAIPVLGGTSTFTASMLPGAPSLHNIVPTSALGTTLTAAPVIGIITSLVTIAFILVYMKFSLSKSLHNKETNHADEKAESSNAIAEGRQLPSFMISLLPIILLLGIILLFSSVDNIIIIALIAAIIMSAILFRRQIARHEELLSQGANDSLSSVITTGSTIAFGSIATSVPAFTGVFQVIRSIPGPPLLSLMIATGLTSCITASSVGAIGIAVQNFAPVYLAMGIDPEILHRSIAIASGALSIVPYNGFLITFNNISGLSMKDTFKYGFVIINVTHMLAMAVIVVMALFGLA